MFQAHFLVYNKIIFKVIEVEKPLHFNVNCLIHSKNIFDSKLNSNT